MRNIPLFPEPIVPANLFVGIDVRNLTLERSGNLQYISISPDSIIYTTNGFYTTGYLQVIVELIYDFFFLFSRGKL